MKDGPGAMLKLRAAVKLPTPGICAHSALFDA